MPHQNRVTPFNELIATPARGILLGNRGVLHDNQGRIVKPFARRVGDSPFQLQEVGSGKF